MYDSEKRCPDYVRSSNYEFVQTCNCLTCVNREARPSRLGEVTISCTVGRSMSDFSKIENQKECYGKL